MLRWSTAGESHGSGLLVIIEGIPAGVPLTTEYLGRELARRQAGYGRGLRMKTHPDRVKILSGVRKERTTGAPIALGVGHLLVDNPIDSDLPGPDPEPGFEWVVPCPGHADMAGYVKRHGISLKDIRERASARQTASWVAAGAVAKAFLDLARISFKSFVRSIGHSCVQGKPGPDDFSKIENSPVRTFDKSVENQMIDEIDAAIQKGDTLGGACELWIDGVPPGIGDYISPDARLDACLAASMMAIPSVKVVRIGAEGIETLSGVDSLDRIKPMPDAPGGVARSTNFAGGIEGGMSNGEQIIIILGCRPIPGVKIPLESVNLSTGEPENHKPMRSDVCVVPAICVIAEAMAALVLAKAMIEKFGGDTVFEFQNNLAFYLNSAKPAWKKN